MPATGCAACTLGCHVSRNGNNALLPEVAIGVAILAVAIVIIATIVSLRRVLVVDPATVFRG